MATNKTILGALLLAGGVVWSAIDWYVGRKRNTLQRLPDKNASPGYYFVEGQLESSSPIVFDNQKYAKLLIRTTMGVQITDNADVSFHSRVDSTVIEQVNHMQRLTIDGIDVTEYLTQFPMVTIKSDQGTTVYGIPVGFGRWRVSGWYSGDKLKKVSGKSIVKYEMAYNEPQTWTSSAVHSTLLTVGAVLVINEAVK